VSESEAVEGIRRAGEQRAYADALLRRATDDLRYYCRAAQAKGVAMTQIALEAGLSRQAVQDLLAEAQPAETPSPRAGAASRSTSK
jgi:DNA-binding phage protein